MMPRRLSCILARLNIVVDGGAGGGGNFIMAMKRSQAYDFLTGLNPIDQSAQLELGRRLGSILHFVA
jgi:hypothetical protein